MKKIIILFVLIISLSLSGCQVLNDLFEGERELYRETGYTIIDETVYLYRYA